MPIAKLKNNVQMYFEVHGAGEPLVLINGLKSDHSGWALMLGKLKDQFQVILLDNRAVGQTKDDGKSYTIAEMACDVACLMDYLHIESAYVAGSSMGGAIAQSLAYTRPEKIKKLFLCNTFIKLNENARQIFENAHDLYKKNAKRSDIMDAIIPLVFSDKFATPMFKNQLREFVEADLFWQNGENYERQLNALNAFDSSCWVEDIKVPTIVISSLEDRTALPQESKMLAHKISNSHLEMIEGGHASAVEQPEIFVDILIKNIIS